MEQIILTRIKAWKKNGNYGGSGMALAMLTSWQATAEKISFLKTKKRSKKNPSWLAQPITGE
jgi:hypothetical protein